MAILNFPDSPVGGSIYVATNGVTYTYDASTTPGVWRATTTAALAVTPGSISGNPIVGATLTYTPGVPSGGTPTYTVTQLWYVDGVATSNTSTSFNVTASEVGKSITVVVTAQDSAVPAVSASATTAPVVILSPVTVTAGSIAAGTPRVGTPITFTPGTASGGTGSYTITYQWKADGGAVAGSPSNTTTYTPAAGDIGKVLTVTTTATDQTYPSLTANATTAPTAAVVPASIAPGVWSPAPNLSTSAESISSGAWNGTVPQTITASGCVEVSLDGTNFSSSVNVTGNVTLYQRWKPSCVGQVSGDTITGSVSAGSQGQNDYSIQLDHRPSNSYSNISSTNVALGATVSQAAATPLAGVNAPAYVTIASSGNTGTNIQASTSATGPWTTLQTTGTNFELLTGQTLYIQQTVGTSTGVGYVANIQVGDDPAVGGAAFSSFTYTATTTSSAGVPGLSFTPTSPNATPATVLIAGESLDGTASSTAGWPIATQTLTTTNILTNINGTSFTTGGTINNGQSLDIAWDPTYIAGISDGNAANGSFSAGIYTNSFTYTVDKNPTYSLPADALTNTPNSTVNTGLFTPTSFNSPIALTYTAGTNTMTNVQASIGGGSLVNVPTSGTSLIVNPGQSVRIYADVGAAPVSGSTAYSITVNLGVNSQTWTQSVPVQPTVTTPSITAPSTGTTVSPALNSPAGVPVTSSGFSSSSGAGTNHASSDWELASDSSFSTIVYSSIGDTTDLTSWFIPIANLTPSTTYYLRVRYNSGTDPGGTGVATTSAYSPTITFSTNNSFVPTPGAQIGGGYFAGQIRVPGGTGTIYNLIVAPRRGTTSGPDPAGTLLGEYSTDGGATPAGIQWKTSGSGPDGGASQNAEYGKTWTDAAGGTTTSGLGGQYPLFGWCKNSTTGPNGGGGIGGFTDWYIPATNELEVLYYYLKPNSTGTEPNSVSSGSNANAVAPEPVSTNYTATNPAQTSAVPFQGTNAQAFSTANLYWSSTEVSTNTGYAWRLNFVNGVFSDYTGNKSVSRFARAVRRILA